MKSYLMNKSVGMKMSVVMSLMLAMTIIGMATANYVLSRGNIVQAAKAQLAAMNNSKVDQVVTLLETIETDLRIRAEMPSTAVALLALTDGFESTENASEVLRRVYIEENPNEADARSELVKADTGGSYGFIHAVYHPTFENLARKQNYADIFLVDTEGSVVYSVQKTEEFATNLENGPWAETAFAQAVRSVVDRGFDDASAFESFSVHAPKGGAATAFMARPVFNENDKRMGAIVYALPVAQFAEIVQSLDGVGESADAFLVGNDQTLMTDARFSDVEDTLVTRVDIAPVNRALSGESGTLDLTWPDGRNVIASFAPVSFLGVDWASIATVGVNDIMAGVYNTLLRMIILAAVIFAAAQVIVVWLARSITRPIAEVTEALQTVSEGNYEIDISNTDRKDEVGALARATEVFKEKTKEMVQLNIQREKDSRRMADLAKEREATALREVKLAKEKEQADVEAAASRAQMMDKLGASFGDVVEAAIEGRFTERVDASFDDEILVDLAENINKLLSIVDKGVTEAGIALQGVAEGDLTRKMEGDFAGSFADLQNNVNAMTSALAGLVSDISASGNTLSSSSNELRDTADDLSRRAEQNAASLEETAASLTELSTTINSVSVNVKGASDSARDARLTAQESETVAAEAATSMDRIAKASKEIARVNGVIDDIAFQINLLALNAGVEAARAGEAGRGFSVVASEVRQLAQRASEAAREIGVVIAESDLAVSEGVAKVGGAKSSLETIANSIIAISSRVDEVSEAIGQQAMGIEEITESVGQIDRNTQRQAAGFEEVSASGSLLAQEAQSLKTSIARFRTGDPLPRVGDAHVQSAASFDVSDVTIRRRAGAAHAWEEF